MPPIRNGSGTGPGTTGDARTREGIRILLVEDDPGSQALIRALCESRGDRVDAASDGFQGLRRLSDGHHDIALIDYHLPEMDGYALARLMKELPRPAGRLRLVGITADRHGLAARRGADRLFDAILVKPVQPQDLFAALDRLARVEAAAPSDPADEVWARRGLGVRPAALLCSADAPRHVEALSQVFRLVARAEEADLVLVADEAGLGPLRALRASGPDGFLPSVALIDRLGPACDVVFRVGAPETWTAVATAGRGFRERRAALAPAAGRDPAGRLLALLAVADRGLTLRRDPTEPAYETGEPPAARMAAILALAGSDKLRCEPFPEGLHVSLTEAGRDSVLQGPTVLSAAPPARSPERGAPAPGTRPDRAVPAPDRAPPPHRSWSPPRIAEQLAEQPAEQPRAAANPHTIAELGRLVGHDRVERLREHLVALLRASFAPEADAETLAREAHVLIAAAGSLGFDHLAACCRALEAAIRSQGDHREALGEARRAARAAMG